MNHLEKTVKNMEIDILKKGERIKKIKTDIRNLEIEIEFIEKSITDTAETIGKLKA